MAFLMKAKKADLIVLAQEIGEEVPARVTMIQLKNLICASSHYEEEIIRELLETIMADRKESEEKKEAKEREEREHELRLKELELKQREIENGRGTVDPSNNMTGNGLMKYLTLVRDQLPKTPQKTENWVFFFHQAETIFQIYEVPNEYQGKIILHRLADLVRCLTNSLGIEKLSDYEAIKECILAENRLTPLQHKRNFENCTKTFQENYVQWAARIRTSLDYYLESREVTTLQTFKDLIISDKMKELLPSHVKAHVLVKEGKCWLKPNDLASEIDMFLEAQPRSSHVKENDEGKYRNWKTCGNPEKEEWEFKINGKGENNNSLDNSNDKSPYQEKSKSANKML